MRPLTAILLLSMTATLGACAPQDTSARPGADAKTGATTAPAPAAPAATPPGADADLRPLPGATPPASTTPAQGDTAMQDDAMQDPCNADAAKSFVGKAASAEVVEQARTAAGADMARVLKPGQVVTMEYRAERLNIDVDAGNTITNVRCG